MVGILLMSANMCAFHRSLQGWNGMRTLTFSRRGTTSSFTDADSAPELSDVVTAVVAAFARRELSADVEGVEVAAGPELA